MIAGQELTANVEFATLGAAEEWRSLLSDEEQTKASGIVNPALRARFEVGRGLRRKVLSEATGLPPKEITFAEAEEGKPRALNAAGWDFNVSHSGEFVALAVGHGQVGVDLEQIRPVREAEAIVGRYFRPDEAAAWRSLAPSLREEAFFVLWSAREAAMKCVGLGLAAGLAITRVDPAVLIEPFAQARVGGKMVGLRRWEAPHGYVAVLAQAAG